jgi:hypothetical protein
MEAIEPLNIRDGSPTVVAMFGDRSNRLQNRDTKIAFSRVMLDRDMRAVAMTCHLLCELEPNPKTAASTNGMP